MYLLQVDANEPLYSSRSDSPRPPDLSRSLKGEAWNGEEGGGLW